MRQREGPHMRALSPAANGSKAVTPGRARPSSARRSRRM
jgi:hypothetical protein